MNWLLLIISLPTENATARMRIWRALKTLGCASLRDGVWLLPSRPDTHARFDGIAEDTHKSGGEAWVLALQADAQQADSFPALFDRSAEYTAWLEELAQFDPLAADIASTRKQLKGLGKRLAAITDTDYFPHPLQTTARERLHTAEAAVRGRTVSAEPTSQQGELERLDKENFQGKNWATRRDLWVDRLASAWLIQRFIDPQAQFLWLDDTAVCPADALGFDFDGARFSHIGRYVTFETLLHSFGLAQDVGLQHLAHLVHTLDVGGNAPEAAGFAVLLKGLKHRASNDDVLLAEGGQLLDDLYCAFSLPEDSL
ncbi:chromate resistance protein ChrB domain-containing protein [Thiothrix unzii]|uniref:Chromate resistance protein n=1 Tax=Thiothrix unzii TaxID=111769 RepID=A0A975F6F5_9GAMM|nr:chromate resistance protein ChrB domain-containing protein [Thiothrix unzii]QTR51913.1 chromate resistance protein [Thiothrix unzii]